MVSRPYMKYLIAGGIVCAEGGPCLLYGLEMVFATYVTGSYSSYLYGGATILTIIGIVALCVGLSLLSKGISERKRWLQQHPQDLTTPYREIWVDRPVSQDLVQTPMERHFCPRCGLRLPRVQDIRYCPKCGENLLP